MKEGQGFARRVTLKTLDNFLPLLRTAKEASEERLRLRGKKKKGPEIDNELESIQNLFKGRSLKTSTPFKRLLTTKPKAKKTKKKKTQIEKPLAKQPTIIKGSLLWQKKMTKSDAQRPYAGHAKGCMMLTQAGWEEGGVPINPRTYFRKDIFAKLPWKKTIEKPGTEEVTVKFDVSIMDKHLGVYFLEMADTPSLEAGQNNYTTRILWGELGQYLRERVDTTGKTIKIYGSSKGSDELFVLEIS